MQSAALMPPWMGAQQLFDVGVGSQFAMAQRWLGEAATGSNWASAMTVPEIDRK